jgi:penicillin-insensitive murein DD-endopeptidase
MRFPTLALGLVALLALSGLLMTQTQNGALFAAASKKSVTVSKKPTAASEEEASEGPAEAETNKKPTRKQAKKAPSKTAKATKPKPTPAKVLFGAAQTPAPLAARSIGFYAKGCLAGAAALPIDGPAWQAMRLSRNRNWGHPDLVALVEKLAVEAKAHDGWPGLLVGDISQPRGGPMLTGHASHQVGLDADVWFTPMPDRTLTHQEREELSATSMLADDSVSVNPKVWTEAHVRLLKRAAGYEAVERVLVHPAIKKAVCDASKTEKDRDWLSKIRPYWGHYYHFHIRMACPDGSPGCKGQPSVDDDNDGCGAELTRWLKLIKPKPVVATPPPKPGKPAPERRAITLDQLPAECRTVLASGTPPPEAASPADKAEAPPAARAEPSAGAIGKAAAAPPTPDKAATPPAADPAVTAPPTADKAEASPPATDKAAGSPPAPGGKPAPAAKAPAAEQAGGKQAKPVPAAKPTKPTPNKASLAD